MFEYLSSTQSLRMASLCTKLLFLKGPSPSAKRLSYPSPIDKSPKPQNSFKTIQKELLLVLISVCFIDCASIVEISFLESTLQYVEVSETPGFKPSDIIRSISLYIHFHFFPYHIINIIQLFVFSLRRA